MLKAKIVAVAESSGVRARELAWERLMPRVDGDLRWSDVAARAAEMWWAETDQCSEAHLTVRIIAADGAFADFAVSCEPRVVYSAREIGSGDGRSGRRVEGMEGVEGVADRAAAMKVIALRCARAAMGQMEYPMDRVVRDLRAVCV